VQDILICDSTPQKITIEAIMPYTNVDIFREKGATSFSKKFGSQVSVLLSDKKKKTFIEN
jgi:hypothetical protein